MWLFLSILAPGSCRLGRVLGMVSDAIMDSNVHSPAQILWSILSGQPFLRPEMG